VKSEEVKTGCNLAESSEEGYDSKTAILPMMMMTMILSSKYSGSQCYILQEKLYKFLLETVQNLYEFIPRRTATILHAKGGPSPN
jgi:hypothetical protein